MPMPGPDGKPVYADGTPIRARGLQRPQEPCQTCLGDEQILVSGDEAGGTANWDRCPDCQPQEPEPCATCGGQPWVDCPCNQPPKSGRSAAAAAEARCEALEGLLTRAADLLADIEALGILEARK